MVQVGCQADGKTTGHVHGTVRCLAWKALKMLYLSKMETAFMMKHLIVLIALRRASGRCKG